MLLKTRSALRSSSENSWSRKRRCKQFLWQLVIKSTSQSFTWWIDEIWYVSSIRKKTRDRLKSPAGITAQQNYSTSQPMKLYIWRINFAIRLINKLLETAVQFPGTWLIASRNNIGSYCPHSSQFSIYACRIEQSSFSQRRKLTQDHAVCFFLSFKENRFHLTSLG